ncbi:hypothetical protein DUNSADRAFT_9013 [Dunaliella salina]|uniref:Encoded protein n=1 Tax=Dunaliella salina TaxID=3046 RepID=A0ABQ7GIA0_DUNSA|nr:hypothetical protein DUNSADRAFT_9013 [Dunaliella salina]|eukprot:KAF5834350.1 hypothetical protein DUNSADRAFT_9013 [Dunaliella salina]
MSRAKAQQQHALRHAALTGAPVQVFQQLLKPQQLKPEARRTSSFSKLTGWKSSKASSTPTCELDFIYEDDGGGTILHYLCCGTSMWHLLNETTSGPGT